MQGAQVSSLIRELEPTCCILRALRASRKAPGHDRIYTAGEKEYINYRKRQTTGVPINRALQKNIIDLQKDYNLSGYSFEFAADWR